MATEIIMPKAGMAMERGTIIQWYKKPGDPVEAGEPLLEIETDKVAMEVEAEVSGYLLSTLFQEGDEVEVIRTIGYIGGKDEKPPVPTDSASSPAAAAAAEGSGAPAPPTPAGVPSGAVINPQREGAIAATPAARAEARRLNISLSSVTPTGKWGEVRRRDLTAIEERISSVARTLAQQHGIDTRGITGSGPAGRIVKQDILDAIQAPPVQTDSETVHQGAITVPMSAMRKVIAQRMTQSHQSIPPVTLNKKIDVTALFALRRQVQEEMERKVSLTPFLVRATALALREAPYMRRTIDGTNLLEHQQVDIGVAVALEEGLIVPVLRNADKLSLLETDDQSQDLFARARERKLTAEELTGAVFSITNLGMYGISSFNPIINPPEIAILGINAAEEELYLEEGDVRVRRVLTLSLTIDHRVIDGAQGAIFLSLLERYLTQPLRLLL